MATATATATAIPTQRRWHSVRDSLSLALVDDGEVVVVVLLDATTVSRSPCLNMFAASRRTRSRTTHQRRRPRQSRSHRGQTHWPGTTAIVDADRAGRRIVEGILRIRLILMVIVASHGRPFPYAVQTSVGSNIPSRGIPGRSHKGHRTRIPAADVHALLPIAARSLELHERARVET